MTASQVQRIREKLQLSQSKFAALLGVSVRTLQGWEQGRHDPNAAAVALLKLAEPGSAGKKAIGMPTLRGGKVEIALTPGRESTPEERARWHAEIVSFIEMVERSKLNVIGAAEYLRRHPLSEEAVAWLAWWAADQGVTQYKSKTGAHAGRAPRTTDALAGVILCILYDSPKADTAAVFTRLRAMAADSHPIIMEVAHGDTMVKWRKTPLGRSSLDDDSDIETPKSDIANRVSNTRKKFRKWRREHFADEVAELKKSYEQ